ncbi:MAG: endo-1,3-alpha-glucanase family glycosylhydrolase [Chloroflexota bacterium]
MPTRILIALLSITLLLTHSPASAQGSPLVLALYYPWFDQGTWESGITADLPTTPYDSYERATIEQHVEWARKAGIDALVSAWFGPGQGNPTESNFATLLEVSQRRGFRAALLLETDNGDFFPDRASLVTALRHFLARHASHPAYLKVDGRPVLFVWRPASVFGDVGTRINRPGPAAIAAWASILDEVDPTRRAIWIAEGEQTGMLEVFDGLFPYSIAWSPNPGAQLQSYAQRVRSFGSSPMKTWIATAMPGYDDTRAPGRARGFAVDRADGEYYRATFTGAIASRPDWIMITSFNEWVEGHQIEPSRTYGDRYLDLTRELTSQFKSGR